MTVFTETEQHSMPIHPSSHGWGTFGENFFYLRDATSGSMLYCSPAYEKIWGRSVESLYLDPLSWRSNLHPEDRDRITKAADSEAGFHDDYRIVRADGEVRWVRGRTYTVPESGTQGPQIVAFVEDITEWKRLETQLTQTQKMDAVGRLAGGIAHDFNNLLTVINGYSAMLSERTDLPPEAHKDLLSIQKAGKRAALLTNQLLTFSRKQGLELKQVNLVNLVSDVEPILRRLIREDVDLEIVPSRGELCVCADPTQMEQVLLNLVINARDAIVGRGCITIDLRDEYFDAARALLHPGCAPGRYVMIAVTDNGRGMDVETQQRIFEPFFTTKQLGQGTGLGLATVYGVVKQSGGIIWVYSEVGVGSSFRVYLPRVLPRNAEPEAPVVAPAKGGTGTVLLVEDEEQVRSMVATVLKTQGYRVLVAGNGVEALEIERRHTGKLDMLVTDVIMPKMGGPELVEHLVPLHPAMRVLYISGYTESSLPQSSIPVHHLPKPFTPNALAQKVSQILESR